MRFWLLPLLLSLSACGDLRLAAVDQGAALPAVNDLYYGLKGRGVDLPRMFAIPILFKDPAPVDAAGVCFNSAFSTEIWLSPGQWGDNHNFQTALVWHEMGHCLFDLPHDNRIEDDGCPASIMHPNNVVRGACLPSRLERYLDELTLAAQSQ